MRRPQVKLMINIIKAIQPWRIVRVHDGRPIPWSGHKRNPFFKNSPPDRPHGW